MILHTLPPEKLLSLCAGLERVLLARGHNREDAKDLVQEALFKSLKANEILSLEGWIKEVALNDGKALRRNQGRRNILLRACHQAQTSQRDDPPVPELDAQEQRKALQAAISRLPAQQRRVIRLWMNNMSFQGIAKKQERSVHYVRIDFHRALNNLRLALSP